MKKQSSVSSRVKTVLDIADREDREVNPKKNEKLVEKELANLVKDIWKKYDRDDNGVLDRDEVKSFVADILNDVKLE
jgi:Ca2+-binding EF-hand superfamily protein